ncbi:c-type cytochrome [Methylobacter luteus]|uniref:c-type cytochrome n=1 Tax=Methylobacter luteus TaxID=415 RepID=UPI0004189EDD|nr:c-type cytochrome [Methylobacter luteus]
MVLKITWKRALATAAALFMLAMAIAWSGVLNIGASTGHWAITDWFLHWSMRNTVRTYAALTVDEPAADAGGLTSAAGHYAANCAFCHGAPGEQPARVMKGATPGAPDLAATAHSWTDRQLFWIVKHGVKFTAMPAWPALDRDDEIRRMAAFVRRLPDMTPAEYRALAYGPDGRIAGGKPVRQEDALPDCERCHADDGRGQPDIPILVGQKPGYLLRALNAYASGKRTSGVMGAAAARLDTDLMQALAKHYAGLPGGLAKARMTASADLTADDRLAERIFANGLKEANLPPCSRCHAPGKRPDYPTLAGQKPEYLAARLRRWRGDETIVDARKPNLPMPVIARRIPERMIEPLARFFARQSAVPNSAGAER